MADDLYAVQIIGSLGGQHVANVLHFEKEGEVSGNPIAGASAVTSMVRAEVEPALMACLPDNYNLQGYKVKRVNNGGGPTFSTATPGSSGSRPGVVSTTGIGPCILMPFADGAKYTTGKIFLAGVSEDDIDENAIDPALRALIDALIDILVAPIVAAGITYVYKILKRSTGLGFTPLSGSVSGKPGVQNRRMRPTF